MPIWLRRYTFSKLKDYFDKQKEESEKAQKKTVPQIAKPNIRSNYNTKASK